MRLSALCITLPLLLVGPTPAALAQNSDTFALNTVQRAANDRAVDAFRMQRYAAAYGRFAELADAGHVPSARMALIMLHNGPTLFGTDWSASAEQQRRWNVLVINSSRQHMAMAGRADLE